MNSYITRVSEAGKEITLADGSRWRVSAFDAFDTMMWLSMDNIQYDSVSLTNLSRKNKRVSAQKVV